MPDQTKTVVLPDNKELLQLRGKINELEQENGTLTDQIATLQRTIEELKMPVILPLIMKDYKGIVDQIISIRHQIRHAGDLRLDTHQVWQLGVQQEALLEMLRDE